MILDCYQCSSCYFEDKEPSSRIDAASISQPQPKMVFRNVLLVFVCIEMYDDKQELQEAAQEFASLSELIGKRPIVLCPNVHLSIDKAPEKQATYLIGELEKMLKNISKNLEASTDIVIERLSAAVEPLIIIVMAAIVGVIAYATILPILEISAVKF